jgi:DNA-binding response OmpR family regulator
MKVSLAGRRILLAEDLYLVAMPVCETLQQAGAEVIGPFPTSAQCLAAMEGQQIDAAVLDIGLADGLVFPVARQLVDEGTPFVFLTGYGEDTVPREFADAPLLLKPLGLGQLCEHLARLLGEPARPSHSGDSDSP